MIFTTHKQPSERRRCPAKGELYMVLIRAAPGPLLWHSLLRELFLAVPLTHLRLLLSITEDFYCTPAEPHLCVLDERSF